MSAAPVIAIDGPSASGKGTVAARVAAQLGFHYLDSGAIYRVLALAALRRALPLDDAGALGTLAQALRAHFAAERVVLEGEDVSTAIRSEAVSAAASRIAAVPSVRAALLERQRAFRRAPGLVADGRDMGSVVFPDAALKVFLTASAEARAQRRYKQLLEKGLSANIAPLLQELRARDERDATRSAAPLQRCEDARLLDTSELDIEQSVAAVLAMVREVLPLAAGAHRK